MYTRIGLFVIVLSVGCAHHPPPPGAPQATPNAADSGPSRFTLAFGSCANQARPIPLLDHVRLRGPDAFVFLGDNVYADTEDEDQMRATYQRLADKPEFQRLLASTRVEATWDDHDYGVNDGGSEYPMKEEAKAIFLDFWGADADDPRRSRAGIYYAVMLKVGGRAVQLIILDTRTFRGPLRASGDDPAFKHRYRPGLDVSLLGEPQWRWLQAQLERPADARVIASSIQFSGDYHGFEAWANAPNERARMLTLLAAGHQAPTLFISGDVHHGELARIKRSDGVSVYDLTSSGLNQAGTILEPSSARVGDAVMAPNAGFITFDWEAEVVHFSLIGEDDVPQLDYTAPMRCLTSACP